VFPFCISPSPHRFNSPGRILIPGARIPPGPSGYIPYLIVRCLFSSCLTPSTRLYQEPDALTTARCLITIIFYLWIWSIASQRADRFRHLFFFSFLHIPGWISLANDLGVCLWAGIVWSCGVGRLFAVIQIPDEIPEAKLVFRCIRGGVAEFLFPGHRGPVCLISLPYYTLGGGRLKSADTAHDGWSCIYIIDSCKDT
jgi:hypothetical protein